MYTYIIINNIYLHLVNLKQFQANFITCTKLLSLAEAVALVLEEDGKEISLLPSEEDLALTDEENINDNLIENC